MCCHHSFLGKLSASWVAVPGEDSWKLVPGFPSTLSHVPFPFARFALYLFTVINHNHEDDCMLSPVSRPSKSLNLGGLRDARHTYISEQVTSTFCALVSSSVKWE